ncbi:MAG: hypothetical protein P4L16_03710 [Chlamydiales bacterium]|nr:hypothetical protein [Chlamydiales bacterium]
MVINKKTTAPTGKSSAGSSALLEKAFEPTGTCGAPSGKQCITKVIIDYDVGFGNSLYIRGQGAGLTWEKGVQLKNVKANEWIWETCATCTVAEFKILINDRQYETGPNHSIKCGSTTQYSPRF